MRKRMEVTAQTRQNLIDAFWSLYCEKRFEKITVREITQRAGYNRGTFYEYFTDVDDVLEQLENSLIPTLDELPPLTMQTRTIGMPMDMFMKLYEHHSRYFSVLLGDNGDPAFASKIKNAIKPAVMKVFAAPSNADRKELDYVLEYALSAMIGIMSYWVRQPDALTSEDLYDLISRVTDQGVIKQLPL